MKTTFIFTFILFQAIFSAAQLSQILPVDFAFKNVYQIKNPKTEETCSSVMVSSEDGKLIYLITARHLFKDDNLLVNGKRTDLLYLHEGKWKSLIGAVKFHPNKNVDIVAVEIPFGKWSKNAFDITTQDLVLGQECIFMGFPFGLSTKVDYSYNRGFDIPWVKYAHVSSLNSQDGIIYLDGFNNKGFSGGPVFTTINKRLTLISIISGYITSNSKINYGDQSVTVPENSGIIISYHSKFIKEIIDYK